MKTAPQSDAQGRTSAAGAGSAGAAHAGLDIRQTMQGIGRRARLAAAAMSRADTAAKNGALLAMANAIEQARDRLIEENKKDMDAGRRDGLDAADRKSVV